MKTASGHARCRIPVPAVAMAIMGAFALSGCSATHVGDSWQCPLARGGSCGSVAAADPAVPDARAAGTPVLPEPLYRIAGARRTGAGNVRPCRTACGGSDPVFDLPGWLARLFGTGDAGDAGDAWRDMGSAHGALEPAAPAAALSQADGTRLPEADAPARDAAGGDDLRTHEVIARIWIAPFVDDGGVYREAAHVRAVLAPAGWRLP